MGFRFRVSGFGFLFWTPFDDDVDNDDCLPEDLAWDYPGVQVTVNAVSDSDYVCSMPRGSNKIVYLF